jgi:hypothetical protein
MFAALDRHGPPYRVATRKTLIVPGCYSDFLDAGPFGVLPRCAVGHLHAAATQSAHCLERAREADARAAKSSDPAQKPNMKRLRGVGETSLAAMSLWKASNDFCWTQIGTKHRCNLSRQRPGSLRRKRISGGVTNK